jgi:hypothetical protein
VAYVFQIIQNTCERRTVSGVLGPMDRGKSKPAGNKAELLQHVRVAARPLPHRQREIEHHIADLVHAARDALAGKVGDGRGGGTEQPFADTIRENAVRLFRHRSERTQAGFDMCNRQIQLGGGHRAGERRIGVAIEQHGRRPLGEHHLLERDDHASGHRAMTTAVDPEPICWRRQVKFAEEQARHVVVEVLSGMDHHFSDAARLERPAHRRRLDELRPGADDRQYSWVGHSTTTAPDEPFILPILRADRARSHDNGGPWPGR